MANCSVPDSTKLENSSSSQIIPTSSAQSNIGIKKIELKEEIFPIKLGETDIKVVVNKSSAATAGYL